MAKDAWKRVVCAIVVVVLCQSAFAPKALGLAESTGPEGSNAQAVNDPCGINETGAGIKVGIIGGQNVYKDHEAFDSNRIYNHQASGLSELIDWHDTVMAGIIASRGTPGSHSDDIGVAPGVEIHSMRIAYSGPSTLPPETTIISDGLSSLVSMGCRVIVSGYDMSNLSVADGNSHLTLEYDYYAYNNNIVFANPAGKFVASSITQTTVPGDAYNDITTGGLILNDPNNQYVYRRVGTESLSGVTVDGRRKPDITAPSDAQTAPSTNGGWLNTNSVGGQNGATSYSGPHTAGVAALLLGLADGTVEADDNQNEVIKAVIVNSTFPNIDDKTGAWTNPADANNAWNADRGYGRINALRAYQLLAAERVYKDTTIAADKGWAFDTVGDGGEHLYTIYGQKRYRLAATLSWNRRIEWDDTSEEGEIDLGELTPHLADLDLRIYEPDNSNAIFSETLLGLNSKDNLEKCDILLTKDGDYTIRIVNDSDNGETASYGFAFELLEPIPADFEPIDYIVDYADLGVLSQQWLETDPDLEANLIADDANRVNMTDLAEFMNYWLESDPAYYGQ